MANRGPSVVCRVSGSRFRSPSRWPACRSFEASSRVLIGAVTMSAPHSCENGERYRVINYKVQQDRMTTIVGFLSYRSLFGEALHCFVL
jgi:hypothetical protein